MNGKWKTELYTDADFHNAILFQYKVKVLQKVQPFGQYVAVEDQAVIDSFSDIAVKTRKIYDENIEEYYPREECQFFVVKRSS